MTRRKILDITSVKKKDHMIFRSSSDGGTTYGPAAVVANTYNASVYQVTGRHRSDRASADMAERTSKEVYWKGFKDVFVVQSDSSYPWEWRRVVFSVKGGPNATGLPVSLYSPVMAVDIAGVPAETAGGGSGEATNPSVLQGVQRSARMFNLLTPTQIQNFTGGLYKGVRGMDFDTGYGMLLSSALDKENVRIHSDVTRSIRSGNDVGVMKKYSMYTPLNQKMIYADQESGSLLTGVTYAASNSPLGDVYVFDLFVQLQGAPGSLTISGQGTAYWHEK